MGYTKGDWGIDGNVGSGFAIPGRSILIVSHIKGERDSDIAFALGYTAKEREANAHLIASAPIGDTLAEAVLNMDYEDYDDFLAILEIARRFRAKAEGK